MTRASERDQAARHALLGELGSITQKRNHEAIRRQFCSKERPALIGENILIYEKSKQLDKKEKREKEGRRRAHGLVNCRAKPTKP